MNKGLYSKIYYHFSSIPLHGIIKTFIKSLTGFASVQYKHNTFSGQLEDINLLFK